MNEFEITAIVAISWKLVLKWRFDNLENCCQFKFDKNANHTEKRQK